MLSPNRKSPSRKSQAGISNIQIMVGVLISAIMVLGGIGMLRMVDQAKVENDLRDLADYKQKTVNLALQHGSLSDVTQEALIDMGFFPASDVSGPKGSRVINSRWKGIMTAAGNGFLIPGDAIAYTLFGVSSAGCKQLGMEAGRIADGIAVTGTWVKLTPFAGGTGAANEPLLISLCDAGKDNLVINFFITKY
jgi:hypothetical protein